MPFWQIFHPVDAYSSEDKKKFAERFVGGLSHPKFVRVKIDQMARTIPGPVLREWWMRRVEEAVAPYVRDSDWEIQIAERPADLGTLQGVIPPPFESIAEKRWVKENRASPYSLDEKIPVDVSFAPGRH